MTLKWRRVDRLQAVPYYINPDEDYCYYAREYVARGGWNASEANQLISNFKKTPDRRGTGEWHYKEQAIEQFAQELAQLLPADYNVTHIPSSKRTDHPDYDSRLEDTLTRLSALRSDITFHKPLYMTESMEPYHLSVGTTTRNPDDIYDKLGWNGLPNETNHIALIDDLLTSGAHFKACQRLVLEHHPALRVFGVFWAKSIWLGDVQNDL